MPSLPTCPIFWENGRLSKNGKIGIGVSATFLFCALLAGIYICCIRRRRNDYDFGLPSELTCKYWVERSIFSLVFYLIPPKANLHLYQFFDYFKLSHGRNCSLPLCWLSCYLIIFLQMLPRSNWKGKKKLFTSKKIEHEFPLDYISHANWINCKLRSIISIELLQLFRLGRLFIQLYRVESYLHNTHINFLFQHKKQAACCLDFDMPQCQTVYQRRGKNMGKERWDCFYS